jgi:hypothetical protein
MRGLLTWLVVSLPAWVRDVRWHARQVYVSREWLRAMRRGSLAED